MKYLLDFIEIENHTFLDSAVRPEAAIVDLGVNRGNFSKVISNRYASRILGAEPDPLLFKKLPNVPNLKVKNVAVAGKSGNLKFFLYDGFDASLVRFAGMEPAGEIEVNVVDLEHFLADDPESEFDLLKMDIEGAEYELIEAAPSSTLRRFRQITVEMHDFLDDGLAENNQRLFCKMQKSGFKRIKFSRTNGDVLFVRSDIFSASVYIKALIFKYYFGSRQMLNRWLKR